MVVHEGDDKQEGGERETGNDERGDKAGCEGRKETIKRRDGRCGVYLRGGLAEIEEGKM